MTLEVYRILGTVEAAGQETLSNSGHVTGANSSGSMPAASLRLTDAVSSSIVVTSTNGNYPFGIRGTVRCPAGMRAFGGGAHFLARSDHTRTAGVVRGALVVTAV